ncbi:uncharacterized protein TRUGW13939_04455 [Talaromyces rugulosus]|uniref:Uncharacterized protein n=1 Tax=Talaromyces rugulosus TaxID=121627 RepID=A0A7H8QX11_TALRU|nr:uncharacterized protein TRUGW13939_04455 [Talaromyces rugulosus]QKX57343.1 hypothetical protein TRUGW13939_04455 [Talaromyces rugulosus]
MAKINWEAQRVVVGHARSWWKRATQNINISIPPRYRPSRIISYAIGVFILFLGLIIFAFIKRGSIVTTTGSSSQSSTPSYQDGELPKDFNLHILVAAQPKNPALCRTITSAMILDYPSLTLLKQRPEIAAKPASKTAASGETRVEKVKSILTFLTNNGRVYDHDLVLIVDSDDTLFQLPPDILIERYKEIHKRNNNRLRRKYGTKFIGEGKNLKEVPKYTQRVLFAARKDCSSNITDSAACASVPQSPLPPDIYGARTDKKRDGTQNRPRWLDSGVVMGQVNDLVPLYEKVLQDMNKQPLHSSEQMVLTQLFGNQEYSREVERRRSSSVLKEWLWDSIGIADYSNITNVRARIQPGAWHEYGMGLDYEGQLFINARKASGDIEWLKYRDVRKVSIVQAQHGVPREVRLNLPLDVEQSELNPFKQYKPSSPQVIKPALNTSIDVLPPSWNFTWNDIPLATYIQTAAVPAIVHTNGDQSLRQDYWLTAWFHPWARALLRRHVRSAQTGATQISALGASDVLKDPGRRGGMWTDNDQWMSFAELCSGHEEVVFGDGLGPWGDEKPNTRPIYNLWGKLMAGKGPKFKKLGELRSEAEDIERLELGIDDDDDDDE